MSNSYAGDDNSYGGSSGDIFTGDTGSGGITEFGGFRIRKGGGKNNITVYALVVGIVVIAFLIRKRMRGNI